MNIDGDRNGAREVQASLQDGSYPRPQLIRRAWADLCGAWAFRFDDENEGRGAHWPLRPAFDRTITVPFPPESEASGIRDTGFHPVVWYHRELTTADLAAAGYRGGASRLILHFGAVDYRCQVWLNDDFLGGHEGGHTPFSFDVTDALVTGRETQTLVVRAEDDPLDVSQPRGKQDWNLKPHAVWYHRTTGIWQPVWLEAVPEVSITTLQWIPDIPGASVRVRLGLSRRPPDATTVTISLSYDQRPLATLSIPAQSDRVDATIRLPDQSNGQGYERLLWAPEHPRLLDAVVTLSRPDAEPGASDVVYSYLGLRSAAVDRGTFLLNDRPYYLRSVLSQGYWPQSHLASPSADALHAEAQLIKDLGFNAARVHQKIEDPRFLFWTDKLGLLVWGETPSAFEFTPIAVKRMMTEWTEALERDLSHPSIVTWVPLNESWGVQHIAHDASMREYSRTLFHLTKALDPSRPVVSNDGWEHLDSDIWTVHDYEWSAPVVRERYADADTRGRLFSGLGPAGRRIRLSDEPDRGQPVMLTEFGGIRFSADEAAGDAWGYSRACSAEDFFERLRSLLVAVQASTFLAGFCYTQLTDTLQEANGLATEDRRPKLPIEQLRALITADGHRNPPVVSL